MSPPPPLPPPSLGRQVDVLVVQRPDVVRGDVLVPQAQFSSEGDVCPKPYALNPKL